jgi:protein subunit release factor B
MADYPVGPDKQKALAARMAALELLEDDLEETFVRSSGPGGQNVNKVSSCVQLVHRPTGTSIRCSESRSQALNRYMARLRLVERIEDQRLGAESDRRKAIEKVRRQKRKRSRRAQEKILDGKHHRSSVKAARRLPGEGDA